MVSESDVYKMSIKELWNYLLTVSDSEVEDSEVSIGDKYTDDIRSIRDGFKLKFSIYKIINDFINEAPSFNSVTVMGIGKYDDSDYYEEIEKRETLLRRIILDNLDDSALTAPRN